MGTLKRGLAVSLAVLSLSVGMVFSSAVQDGELHLDGQRGESEIWDESYYISLGEAGILTGSCGITYASLNYRIDDNRKCIYLYFQYLDESPESGTVSAVQLTLAEGTVLSFYTDGRPISAGCGTVDYCALDLGMAGICLEAEIRFDTVAGAQDALEALSITIIDRAGRQTGSYQMVPVFPPVPGETLPPATESASDGDRETTTRKNASSESTTKKKNSTTEKAKSTTRRTTTKKSTEDEEDQELEEGRTVDYIVSGESQSDYRIMTAAVCALLIILAAACIGWFVHHLTRKKKEKKSAGSPQNVPQPEHASAGSERFDDGPEERKTPPDKGEQP